ncbi:hypothetical protein HMPREF3190_01403 [Umbribacter vaginalis]|nr:hypothetical protein HMPREF3190_01403 [Coriobacteriales bacterium DNF00809]
MEHKSSTYRNKALFLRSFLCGTARSATPPLQHVNLCQSLSSDQLSCATYRVNS